MSTITAWISRNRPLLDRTSAAERAAGAIREMIMEGVLRPGDRLSEEELAGPLGVSRNTLREAFRLLGHENLVVHELNRGVFVRTLTADDVVDIYRVRALVECAAIRRAGTADRAAIEQLAEAVRAGEAAAQEQHWSAVGTCNIHFHRGLARLLGSSRIDETMGRLLAELRLAFHVMTDPRAFHEPYLVWNRRILTLVESGDLDTAEEELTRYLAEAGRQLAEVYPGPAD
jgi:DNA-binding GntR family transcriptional regulator